MAEAGLGLETGGTASRWALATADGTLLARGEVAPMTGHVFEEAVERRYRATIAGLAEAVLGHARPVAVLAGITGLGEGPELAFFREALAAALKVDPPRVHLVDDMWLGYRALFAPGEGIVVYAGTGSIGYHLTQAGEAVRAGGRGLIIDDAGSATWIARRALRAVLRMEDAAPGAGFASALGRQLATGVGSGTWEAVRAFTYGGDRGRLGRLALCVAAAAREGDATAAAIFEEAGRELARLALVLRERVGRKPVALTGRAAGLDPRIAEAFRALVGEPLAPMREADAAAVAARLALTL